MTTTATMLPDGFSELEPYVPDWARSTREERYDTRLSKTIEEIEEFYDAVAARAEDAIAYLNARDLDALTEADTRLLQLLYSLILVSYSVNIFSQPRIPDSGSAFFDCVVEPAV